MGVPLSCVANQAPPALCLCLRLNLCALASLREIFLHSRIGVTVLTKILQFERIILAKPYFF